jgi:hypothetical protein
MPELSVAGGPEPLGGEPKSRHAQIGSMTDSTTLQIPLFHIMTRDIHDGLAPMERRAWDAYSALDKELVHRSNTPTAISSC